MMLHVHIIIFKLLLSWKYTILHNVHRGGGFGGWKKDESHFPFDSDRVFHLPDLSWDISPSISHSI